MTAHEKFLGSDVCAEDSDDERATLRLRLISVVDFLVWLGGVGVLSVGLYCYLDMLDADYFVGPLVSRTSNHLLLASGSFAIVFGILLCFGIFNSRKLALCSFAYFAAFVFAFQCTIAALALTWRSEIQFIVKEKLVQYVAKDFVPEMRGTPAYVSLGNIHLKFRCCGALNYKDWTGSAWIRDQSDATLLPLSCCKEQVTENDCRLTQLHNIYQRGCVAPVAERYRVNLLLTGIVAIINTFLLLLCFLATNALMFQLE